MMKEADATTPTTQVLPTSKAGTLYYSARRSEDADWFERMNHRYPTQMRDLAHRVDCTNLVGGGGDGDFFYAWNNFTRDMITLPGRVYDLPALDFGDAVVVGKTAVEAWLRGGWRCWWRRLKCYFCCCWRPPAVSRHQAVATIAMIRGSSTPPLGCTMRQSQCVRSAYWPPAVPAAAEVVVDDCTAASSAPYCAIVVNDVVVAAAMEEKGATAPPS